MKFLEKLTEHRVGFFFRSVIIGAYAAVPQSDHHESTRKGPSDIIRAGDPGA
jgi:hypothetical protein